MSFGSKSDRPVNDDHLDTILHALSDRSRRRILKRLTAGPAIITELAAPFAITRVAVAKHLRVLERAGLVSRTAQGRVRRCSMNAAPLREVEHWLSDYRAFWTTKLDSLARFAEAGNPVVRRTRKKK